MTLLTPRRALVAGLALAAGLAALPSAGSARPLTHPDGPDCGPIPPQQLGAPFKTSLPYILKHGFQFGFGCQGYYKGGLEYDARYKADGTRRTDKELNPDTNWPADAKYTLKGEVTMPASAQHALGLSSRIAASGTLTGPKPYDDLKNSTQTDAWTLKLKPAFEAALKRKKVAYISLDYAIDVSLPGYDTASVDPNTGKVTPVTIPDSVAHLTNDSDFKFINDAAWTPKCKNAGKDVATGCPGA